jgi:hypothetical protein
MTHEESKNADSFAGRPKRAWVYVGMTAVLLSVSAFTIVVANVAAGTPRQPDENAWAHLFQVAMAAQLPLVLLFLALADWTHRRRVIILLAAQIIATAAAFAALAWSGY